MNTAASSSPSQSSMYQVTNYTSDELFSILSLDPATATESDVMDATDNYISSFSARGMTSEMVFFQDIQTYLLQLMDEEGGEDANELDTNELDTNELDTNELDTNELDDDNEDEHENESNPNDYEDGPSGGGVPNTYIGNQAQTTAWSEHAALPQQDATQTDKITQRKQKIDVYDNEALPMKREQLGVTNQFNVPVVQDTLNPNLQNTITRFINLDSQYRQTAVGAVDSGSTDYTLDLSDTLTNVLNMRLYSFQIPFTWYAIDTHLGNTCIWIQIQPQDTDADIGSTPLTIPVHIPPGNYSQASFITQFTQSVLDAGLEPPPSPNSAIPIAINSNNAKATIQLYGWTTTVSPSDADTTDPVTIAITDTTTILFYDPSGAYTCNVGCGSQTQVIDGTLGWLMGFRSDSVRVAQGGNVADAVIDLAGPKYFILAIDDYNQNRINNGLVTITELSKSIKMPSYYNTSQPNICVEIAGATRPRTMAMVVPSAPRTITRAQIYTINEIVKTRQTTTRVRGRPPSISDTFAILAIKHNGLKTGDMYVEFAGALQDNKRIYFGPVDVGRMRVRLLDDRGNTVNLNGSEWCVTILSEQLYQY